MKSKVSVVIPTYNRAEMLGTAISSVLAQTYQNIEIIVVDDASQDDTQEVVNSFNKKRIRYLRHDRNKGEAAARNTGIQNISGDYIAFLDDDDEWLPDKLMLQMQVLQNTTRKTGLIYCGFLVVDKDSHKVLRQRMPSNNGNVHDALMKCNFIAAPSTVIIRKECIKKIGLFDEKIAYGLDYDMWIRISKQYHFDYVGQPLVKYHIHPQRLTTNYVLRADGLDDMLKKYGARFILNNNYYRESLLMIGRELCDAGKMSLARKKLFMAIRFNPLEISPYFFFGVSLFSHQIYRWLQYVKKKTMSHYIGAS